MGPRARSGCTTTPPCTMSMVAPCASRRAAARTASMRCASCFSSSGSTSDGQIVAPRARLPRRARMRVSSSIVSSRPRRPRQRSLQWTTSAQLRAHFFRHAKLRPHVPHTFWGRFKGRVAPPWRATHSCARRPRRHAPAFLAIASARPRAARSCERCRRARPRGAQERPSTWA